MFFTNPFKSRMPSQAEALPGRNVAIMSPRPHAVHGRPITAPFPEGHKSVMIGMGCFWGGRASFLAIRGRLYHRSWLCWRPDGKSDL